MLDFPKPTAQDLKIAANIERKRRLEEERKARIFNARIRKIGVRIFYVIELFNLSNELEKMDEYTCIYRHIMLLNILLYISNSILL